MIWRTIIVIIAAIVTGLIASLASLVFVWLVEAGNNLFFTTVSTNGMPHMDTALIISVPVVGGLLVGLLCWRGKSPGPLSLVDTIGTAQTLSYAKSPLPALKSVLASVVGLASGASVGQYGPVGQLGALIGEAMGKLERASGFTPAMGIGCGVAAAIATVFNAPLAGLVFAHEVVLRHFSLRSFAPVTVSAVCGYIVAHLLLDSPPMFGVMVSARLHTGEFLVFALIGVLGAFFATAFMKLIVRTSEFAATLPVPPWLRPALAGAVLGITGIWFPEVLGIGQDFMTSMFYSNELSPVDLALTLVAKLSMTVLCLGFGFAGGVFSPAIFMGIMVGALVGDVAPVLLGSQFSIPTPYIICGMMAVASPVIGAPLTAILIVFELTANYDFAIAAMTAVVFSNLVGYRLFGRSFYDYQLARRGVNLSMGRDRAILSQRDISSCLSADYLVFTGDQSSREIRSRLAGNRMSEGFVVNDAGQSTGCITLVALEALEHDERQPGAWLEALDSTRPVLRSDTSVWDAMEAIQDFVGESVVVMDAENSTKIAGVVNESILIKRYVGILREIRDEEYGVV